VYAAFCVCDDAAIFWQKMFWCLNPQLMFNINSLADSVIMLNTTYLEQMDHGLLRIVITMRFPGRASEPWACAVVFMFFQTNKA